MATLGGGHTCQATALGFAYLSPSLVGQVSGMEAVMEKGGAGGFRLS